MDYFKIPFTSSGIHIVDARNKLVASMINKDGEFSNEYASQLPAIVACLNNTLDGVFSSVTYNPQNLQISVSFGGVEFPILKVAHWSDAEENIGYWIAGQLQM